MKTLFSIGKFDTFKAAHLEKHPKEKAIFDIIEKHFGKFLSFEHDAVIYGGFCRRILGGESLINADINMIGFYHMMNAGHSEQDVQDFWDHINRHHVENTRNYINAYQGSTYRVYNIDTLRFSLYEYDGSNMAAILNNADFTCSRVFTDFQDVYVFSQQDVEDIKAKVLRLSKDNTQYVWTRKERIKKFTEMGWTLSGELVATITSSMRGGSSIFLDTPKLKKKSRANLGGFDAVLAAQPAPDYYVAPPVRNDDIFAVAFDDAPQPAQPAEAVVGRWVHQEAVARPEPQPAQNWAVQARAAEEAIGQLARRYQAEAYRREQQAQANIRGPRQRG